MAKFHWKDGWYFQRMADAGVQVTHHQFGSHEVVEMEIPPREWASIVAAVSAAGETTERFDTALNYHYGFDVKAAAEDANKERFL